MSEIEKSEVTLSKFKELLNKIGLPAEFEPAFMTLYENMLNSNMLNILEFAIAKDLETDNEAQAFISKILELSESTSVATESGAEITYAEMELLSSGLRYSVWNGICFEDEWDWMTGTEDAPSIPSADNSVQCIVINIANLFYKAYNNFFAAVSELLLSGSKPDEGIYWLDRFCLKKYPAEVFDNDGKCYRIGRFTYPGEDEFGNQLAITWARTKWSFTYNVDRGISFPIYISQQALEQLRQFCQEQGLSINANVFRIAEALENQEPTAISQMFGYGIIPAYVNNGIIAEFTVHISNDRLIATHFLVRKPDEVNETNAAIDNFFA